MKTNKFIYLLMMIVINLMFTFNINAYTNTHDMEGYEAKIKHDPKTGKLFISGNNNNGRFGIDKKIKVVSETDEVDVSKKINSKIKWYSITNDNLFVVTFDGKGYGAGSNRYGQLGKKENKDYDYFFQIPYTKKYKVTSLGADEDSKFRTTYLAWTDKDPKNCSGEGDETYEKRIGYNKMVKKVDKYKIPTYNILLTCKVPNNENIENIGYLYNTKTGKKIYEGYSYFFKTPKIPYKLKITDRMVERYYNSQGKLLWEQHITYYQTQPYNDFPSGRTVKTKYIRNKYDKNNKLIYSYQYKKNKHKKNTYVLKYQKNNKGKITKKVYKAKYKGKNAQKKVLYTFNKAGQLKSNKHGKAYKVVTKYDDYGNKISKTTYQYNSKGIAKKLKN